MNIGDLIGPLGEIGFGEAKQIIDRDRWIFQHNFHRGGVVFLSVARKPPGSTFGNRRRCSKNQFRIGRQLTKVSQDALEVLLIILN